MKTMKLLLTALSMLSLTANAQCPVDIKCTSDQFKFVFTTLPNSGDVDEVELKIDGRLFITGLKMSQLKAKLAEYIIKGSTVKHPQIKCSGAYSPHLIDAKQCLATFILFIVRHF